MFILKNLIYLSKRMSKHMILAVICCVLFISETQSWLFGGDKSKNHATTEEVKVPSGSKAPFEMKTTDEKFFLQAMTTKELSPLDACHHRVVLEIEKTCSDMSEEDLSKMAVHLLNCQSKIEDRKIYPCTSHMTIAECTKQMDPTTWNAYQIVSNRARAICYQTRQQQFRMKTENTVNSLVYSAQQQVETMETMQESQSKMISSATETLNQVKSDQAELISQHGRLRSQQAHIQSSLALTVRDLYREKALIAAGHQAFAQMTTEIKDGLDGARDLLVSQEKERQDNHREILEDLANIRGKAKQVWDKIDDNSEKVLRFQKETQVHYEETLQNLEKVNHTVNYVVRLVNDTRTSVETKLNWLLGLVGTSGDRITFITTVLLHILYFILTAFSASFLRTPFFTRLMLMMLVPLNAWSEIKQGTSLGFLAMTMFIVLSTAANWVVGRVCHCMVFRKKHALPGITHIPSHILSHTSAIQSATYPDTQLATQGGSKKGLSSEELQKLMDILQRLHDSGMLSPQGPSGELPTPAESLPDQEVPVNTPISAPGNHDGNKFTFSDAVTLSALKGEGDFKDNVGVNGTPRVELVRRHLMKTLADGESCDHFGRPLTPSDTPSRTSTPHSTPRSTPVSTPKRANMSDVLNKSSLKPQCLATTKAGHACKNSAMDGSGFCFRHQVA